MTPTGSVRVKEGSLLNISCKVAGDPPPSLTWQKISSSGSSQVIRSDSPSLEMEMTSVGREDEGTYVCVASSLAGQVEERLQVSVSADNKGELILSGFLLFHLSS